VTVAEAAAALTITAATIVAAPIRLEPVSASAVASPSTPSPNIPFSGQLARPIFTLATAAPGLHTMTISVTPDALGPVTVRAHVSWDGIRVELFAPTELARDAIRAILPELRKDLAGEGVGADLDLSSQNQPSDAGDPRGDAARCSDRTYFVPSGIVVDDGVAAAATRILSSSSIDVLA
jgi:flagellar hook-length control protein FliK